MFKKKQKNLDVDLMLTEVKDTSAPAIIWINSLFMYMYKDSVSDFTLRKSDGIPSIPLQDELPNGELSFDKIVNRMKIMSGLDPILFTKPKEGRVEMLLGGVWYLAEILFDDSADDPTYRVSMSIIQQRSK